MNIVSPLNPVGAGLVVGSWPAMPGVDRADAEEESDKVIAAVRVPMSI